MIPALIAASVFSLYDYGGYNVTRSDATALACYRVSQVVLQAAITYLLWKEYGAESAVKFTVIWWTFGCDWLYYGWGNLFNPKHGWDSRGDPRAERIPWAWWTPVGLAGGGRGYAPPIGAVKIQSFIGLSISILI